MEPLRVLVVDDNQAHADGLVELLGLAGFEASRVETGAEGIEFARKLALDAVLLDVNLPDMLGFEVCQRLRSDPRTAHIAVIFHTGSSPLPSDKHDWDAILTYPVQMSDVYAAVRGCVERRRRGVMAK
jgi:two-component system NtrC family sensor kinase